MNHPGRYLTRERVRAVCVSVVGVNAVLLALSFYTPTNRTPFGHYLGADFAAFYYGGEGLNDGLNIYAPGVHETIMARTRPDAAILPVMNPPFFAALFKPLAILPYAWAYALWLLIASAVYAAGVRLVWLTTDLPGQTWPDVLLIALAFAPFATYTLVGGQQSWFGFFWLALAVFLSHKGRDFAAGLALSACSYKPTLLLVILPALLLRGRFRLLAGFAVGCAALALLSYAAVGHEGCVEYVRLNLAGFGNKTSTSAAYRLQKWADVTSFLTLIFKSSVGVWPFALCWIAVLVARPRLDESIAWTAPVNLYTPLYDVSLILIPALRSYRGTGRERVLFALLFAVPWASEHVARLTGFIPLTPLLVAFALAVREWSARTSPRYTPRSRPAPSSSAPANTE
jgi:hypothetical protein